MKGEERNGVAGNLLIISGITVSTYGCRVVGMVCQSINIQKIGRHGD